MTRPPEVTAELRVQFKAPPTATYVCFRCGTTEGPVEGARPVRSFIEHVRGVHASRCHPTT